MTKHRPAAFSTALLLTALLSSSVLAASPNGSLAIEAVNQAPVAVDDPSEACGPTADTGGSFLLPEYDPGPGRDPEIALFGSCALLANDTDADGDELTYEIVDPPSHGTATLIDAEFTSYAPDVDYGTRPGNVPGGTWVSDSFTYRAFDGVAYSEPATMRFWIAEINDAPSFTPGLDVTVAEDSGAYAATWATDISVGPESEAWQTVVFELEPAPVDPVALFAVEPSVASDGTLSFTPAANAQGSADFTIQAKDDGGVEDYGIGSPQVFPDDTSDPVTFTITVTDQNAAPVADDDTLTVAEGAPPTTVPVLVGDADQDGDPISIVSTTNGAKGTVAITGGGTGLTYDPAPLQQGSDSFTYTIEDGAGGSDTATVHVTIVPDTTGPVVATATERFPGQTIGTNTVRVRLSWSATDPGSGINNYHLQQSVDGGSWSSLALSSPTATSIDRTLTFGKSYRYRVRAKDGSGNVGAFREWVLLRPTLYQETNTIAKYIGSWTTVVNPAASGGSTRAATASDRKVTVTFTGHDIGWVTTRRTSSGRAEVRVDGVLIATVDLDTTTDSFRQLVFARHFSSLAQHTLEIRPLGDGRVDLDAVVVLR